MVSPPEKRPTAAEDAGEPSEKKQDFEGHRNNRDREGDREGDQEGYQCPLARQSSLMCLTLDEIKNTFCEPGRSFGSMNMDELVSNIWTVEEGNAMGGGGGGGGGGPEDPGGGGNSAPDVGQPSLYRQGSLSLPVPLCRKTVDEVWSEIHRGQQEPSQGHPQQHQQPQYQSSGNAPRQPTFGVMTLEDFLVKAGIVREGGYPPCSASPQPLNQQPLHPQQPDQYGLPGYPVTVNERPAYGHMAAVGYGDHQNAATAANGVYQEEGGVVSSSVNGYGGGGGGGGGFGYGVRIGNGYGADHQQQMGVGSPMSPCSSDGLGCGQVDNNPDGQWGLDLGGGVAIGGAGARGGADGGGGVGRKRVLDRPVERVVERRQRRMIKNRESAARSRARKQAYTVELEGELNQLKEENARLQEEQRRLTARRKQMLLECMVEQSQTNARRKAKTLRRNTSCLW